jgi:hypothetical protein
MPNVGKSTLFNGKSASKLFAQFFGTRYSKQTWQTIPTDRALAALTNTQNAEAANYPFCTIKPNVGLVSIRESTFPEAPLYLYGIRILSQHEIVCVS